MALGALVLAVKLVSPRQVAWFLKNIVILILFPILIFRNVIFHLKIEQVNLIFYTFFGAIMMVTLSYLVSFISHYLGRGKTEKRSFILAGTFHNYGFTALPVMQSQLLPAMMPMAFTFIVTCDALFWALGGFIMRRRGAAFPLKQILSPPFLGLLVSVIVVVAGFSTEIPATFIEALAWPAKVTLPLALFCIGATFYASFHDISEEEQSPFDRTSFSLLLIQRHLVIPIIWLAVSLSGVVHIELGKLFYIEAIMPSSIGIVILSSLYHGDSRFIATFSVTSNLLSIATIAFFLYIRF